MAAKNRDKVYCETTADKYIVAEADAEFCDPRVDTTRVNWQ